jgi:tRNA threonylcarbamoyladenosine biosynthesis protein TsaE
VPPAEIISRSPEETIEIGRSLAHRLAVPALVLLSGDLGSGKTTLAQGIISGLGAAREEDVTSPTFTLIHMFHNGTVVYHVDLYRVEQLHDLETLGLDDALAEPAIVIVEWPEHFMLRSDWPTMRVKFEHVEGDTRRITISDSASRRVCFL